MRLNKRKCLFLSLILLVCCFMFIGFGKTVNIKNDLRSYSEPVNKAFVDDNFYSCVVDAYNETNGTDIGYDVSLTDEQLQTIEILTCNGNDEKKVVDTTGIEKLTSLRMLYLNENMISQIDLSQNVSLGELFLSFNEISNIDLSNNIYLENLAIDNNKLSEIDLSKNTVLRSLWLNDNELSGIDLSNNIYLVELYLANNNIENINLINNVNLNSLNISNNQLTGIDLSRNKQLMSLDLNNNNLTNINLSNNMFIDYLDLSNNELESIDLLKNTNLEYLNLSYNNLTSISTVINVYIKTLNLSYNDLNSIDLSNNQALQELFLEDNNLTEIDLSLNPYLERIFLKNNILSSISFGDHDSLETINLSGNELSSIDLTNITSLNLLDLSFNKIKDISLGQNINLEILNLSYNLLNELDLSKNNKLDEVNLDYNYLSQLDLSQNVNLRDVRLYGNQLVNVICNSFSCPIDLERDKQKKDVYIHNNDFSLVNDDVLLNLVKNNGDDKDSYIGQYSYKDESNVEKFYDFEYIIRRYTVVSDLYTVGDKYIYTGDYADDASIFNDIRLANESPMDYFIYKKVEDGKFLVMYDNTIVKEFDIVYHSSDKYDLNKNYIMVDDTDISSFISSFDCTNCSVKVFDGTNYLDTGEFGENHKLVFMYEDEVLKEYELKHSPSINVTVEELKLDLGSNNTFTLEAEIYPSFAYDKTILWTSSDINVATVDSDGVVTAKGVGNAVITGTTIDGATDICTVEVSGKSYTITYKDGNIIKTESYVEGEKVNFKSDFTRPGFNLIGWIYNDVKYSLTDNFIMPSSDIELIASWEEVNIDITNYEVDGKYIIGIPLNTDISAVDLGIDDVYQVTIYNHGNEIKASGLIGTGDKIRVFLNGNLYDDYEVIIKGDLTGDGETKIGDVAKLYQYFKNTISMDECYIKAGNVVDSDDIIKIGDVAKLYQFFKKTIDSL